MDRLSDASRGPGAVLSDMLAAVEALRPQGPAGFKVHPLDFERLKQLFPRSDSAPTWYGPTMLRGLELIVTSTVMAGFPEPLTIEQLNEIRKGDRLWTV